MATRLPSDRLATIFGGSGFLGRYAVKALVDRGWRVRVAVRRPDLARHVTTAGMVGQVTTVQANLRYPDSVARAVEGAEAVVNLVGILHESGRNNFAAVQRFGAATVARAAAAAGASRLVHVSAIGADRRSEADYARTKAEGEEAVLAAFPAAVILRPSLIFGREDDFFNRFAAMARLAPALPLIGGGATRFQPVFAGDVGEAIGLGVDGALRPGAIYELGGPEVKSFRELMQYILAVTHRRRLLLPVPFGLAMLQASVLQFLPKPPITPGQVIMLRRDNVVSDAAKAEGLTLEGMGIDPVSIETVVPTYLWRFRRAGEFERAAA